MKDQMGIMEQIIVNQIGNKPVYLSRRMTVNVAIPVFILRW